MSLQNSKRMLQNVPGNAFSATVLQEGNRIAPERQGGRRGGLVLHRGQWPWSEKWNRKSWNTTSYKNWDGIIEQINASRQ